MTVDEEAKTPDGLTLEELEREIPGEPMLEGDGSVRVRGVHHDSRRVGPGDLFVVRRGSTHDGRAFIASAKEKGAAAILAEPGVDAYGLPALRIADVPTALAHAAAAVYGHPAFALDVIGITGTNGKTTTTHLVRAAIDGAFGLPLCGTIGTVGHTFAGRTIDAAHTTPESDELARVMAVMKKRGATHVAMEVSSIALVAKRVAAVRFRVAAFTNLTQDHLDYHGTMEAYAAAKMELFTTLAPGLAVVNVGDPFGVEIAKRAKCKTLRVRTAVGAKDADIVPESVEAKASGMRIVANTPSGRVELATRLVGQHNVENLLVALGCVIALDLDVERAAAALGTEGGAPGRLERCDGPDDDITVLVDYAHTPDALARALDAVRAVAEGSGRVVCVFGCGGDRDPTKRFPMGEAVGGRADVAIVTSDNPRTEDPAAIAKPVEEGVRAAGGSPIVELDRAQAIQRAIAEAKGGDVVLVAGKGHEDYQIIGKDKRHFDDREEARNALADRRGRTPRSPGR
jgi:UDP-N-acetylmuramoyl-L-alanyl-D-glutamate--2,6-diaminopimelate ligase